MTLSSALQSAFWFDSRPLVLASKSKGRRLALEQTGIPFIVRPVEFDERLSEREILQQGKGADEVAKRLARGKAIEASRSEKGSLVLGADQLASCENRLFGKPATIEQAAEHLRFLSGRTHRLHSAALLVRDGAVLFETVCHADLRMRLFDAGFIAKYLAVVGSDALASAGAYQAEGFGVHLFEQITGDHWTILGLPLLPILAALRREGVLLA
ncbi:MAG: Maf family protein [Methylocystis sp.]|nr:Maf family protein [Methylocystis sp.]